MFGHVQPSKLFQLAHADTLWAPLCRIWSCAAVTMDPYSVEQLAGFITAKSVFLHEVDASVSLILSAVLALTEPKEAFTFGCRHSTS